MNDTTNITTQLSAFWGAILSTILAVIEVMKFRQDRLRLKIKVKGDWLVYPKDTIYGDKTYVIITISNIGRRPVTVTHASLRRAKGYILAGECFKQGQKEVIEGKSIEYLIREDEIQKMSLLPRDYTAVVSDARGRQYYSHILPIRWFKVARMRLFAKKGQKQNMTDKKQISFLKGAGITISIVALLASIASCIFSYKANRISEKANSIAEKAYQRGEEIFKIQHTPRLSAQIYGDSYVGKMEGRIDEVVTVPMIVLNNSDAFAYDVILDLLISDGTGRMVSLNDYFKDNNIPIIKKERLLPREQWLVGRRAISAPNNAKEFYSTGKLIFKAKLQLSWKDVSGKQYKFIDMEELKYIKVIDETIIETFSFSPMKRYDSIVNKEGLEENWGLNFNF